MINRKFVQGFLVLVISGILSLLTAQSAAGLSDDKGSDNSSYELRASEVYFAPEVISVVIFPADQNAGSHQTADWNQEKSHSQQEVKKEQTGEKEEQEIQKESEEQPKQELSEQQETEEKQPVPEEKKKITDWLDPWKKTLELSYVVTGGNTLSSSFSFGANLTRSPNDKNTYMLKTFLLRSHSTTVTRMAVGTPENYSVEEEKNRRLSAENYILSGQYDHRVTGRLTTNLAFVWDRNKFSGVLSRALWTAGAGLVIADNQKTRMRSQAGVSFTIRKYSQKPVSAFLGFRYSFSWEQKLFDNASFATAFIFDDNLTKISDWRYEWNFNVAAPINKKLSLKTGVRILRNNRPPDLSVPLFDLNGLDTGIKVFIPRGKVDTFFTTSFVLNL
ncbi:MAG: DUF481 domain-containing protein [Candidatus Saccharicenans sp.]|nr:DUF481 domain-containing protein [Candidatus Saccharicenans sp.]